jgi:hypothetical protein
MAWRRSNRLHYLLAGLLLAGSTSSAYLVYNTLRTWDDHVGFDAAFTVPVVAILVFVLCTVTAAIWAFYWAVYAEIRSAVCRARAGRNRCPVCAYSLRGLSGSTCPECGVSAQSGRSGRGPHEREVLIIVGISSVVLAAVLGVAACITAEALILHDEREFRREVSAITIPPGQVYGRPRAWPNQHGSLVARSDGRIHSTG